MLASYNVVEHRNAALGRGIDPLFWPCGDHVLADLYRLPIQEIVIAIWSGKIIKYTLYAYVVPAFREPSSHGSRDMRPIGSHGICRPCDGYVRPFVVPSLTGDGACCVYLPDRVAEGRTPAELAGCMRRGPLRSANTACRKS